MALYWFLFLIPSLWALGYAKPRYLPSRSASPSPLWTLVLVVLTLLIGLRYEVGGDWGNYLSYAEAVQILSLEEAISTSDPGYALLNWIGAKLGAEVYLANITCGLLFTIGLIIFCKQLPRPWLGLAIAMPYLVLVVAMGYSRQSAALGAVMLGLVALQKSHLKRFLLAIGLAGLFHKSAVLIVLIAVVLRTKNQVLTLAATLIVGLALYALLLAEAVGDLYTHYLGDRYQSSGAGVRVAMNALPGLIFLYFKKHLILSPEKRRLWVFMAWTSIGFVGLLFVSPSSTAVDRAALYLIPLQLFVWSHFPDVTGQVGRRNLLAVLMVLSFYAAVLFIWLFFADHRHGWIPYKFFPFEIL